MFEIRYQIFIAGGETQTHKNRQIELTRDGYNDQKGYTNHPELSAGHVHLCRISQQLYGSDETENNENHVDDRQRR